MKSSSCSFTSKLFILFTSLTLAPRTVIFVWTVATETRACVCVCVCVCVWLSGFISSSRLTFECNGE